MKPRLPIRVFAHRGKGFEPKENSLAAFRKVVQHPEIYGVELDVHFTREGVPVIHHDPLVNFRGEPTPIEEIAFRDMGFFLPTLYDALAILLPTHRVIVEIKDTQHPLDTLFPLLQGNEDLLWISSHQWEILEAFRQNLPQLRRTILLPAEYTVTLEDTLRFARQIEAEAIHLPYPFSEEWVRRIQKEGFQIRFYGVEKPSEVLDILRMGVYEFMTDHPIRLLHWLKEEERKGTLKGLRRAAP